MAGTVIVERLSAPDFTSLADNPQEALAQLTIEFAKMVSVVNELIAGGTLEVTTVAPTKPRTGMLRIADGTSWNPGSGRGVYWYDGGVPGWVKL